MFIHPELKSTAVTFLREYPHNEIVQADYAGFVLGHNHIELYKVVSYRHTPRWYVNHADPEPRYIPINYMVLADIPKDAYYIQVGYGLQTVARAISWGVMTILSEVPTDVTKDWWLLTNLHNINLIPFSYNWSPHV